MSANTTTIQWILNDSVYLLKQTAMYFILIKYVGIVGEISYLDIGTGNIAFRV